MANPDERGVWGVTFGDFAELRDVSHHPRPKPADLASDVLDALTRKLRDYDRLAAALTSAQTEATRQTERARKAEDERNMYKVACAQAREHAREKDAAIHEAEMTIDALRANAKPDPPLTPLVLIETVTNAHGRKQTAYYEGDIALTWRRADGLVSEWTLAMGETTTFGADGACRTDDALGDVNAMLARYGYVLEAWP